METKHKVNSEVEGHQPDTHIHSQEVKDKGHLSHIPNNSPEVKVKDHLSEILNDSPEEPQNGLFDMDRDMNWCKPCQGSKPGQNKIFIICLGCELWPKWAVQFTLLRWDMTV